MNLAGWYVPQNVSNSTSDDIMLYKCDYFESEKGYVYSLIDNGIGPVILDYLKNSTMSMETE